MKKLIFALFAFVALTIVSCKHNETEKEVVATELDSTKVDSTKSVEVKADTVKTVDTAKTVTPAKKAN
jgi:hypothetical protein